MIRQCFLAKTGIQFVPDSFKDVGLDPANFFPTLTQQPQAPNPPASTAPDAKASAHAAEPTDATLVDETKISLTAASTFNSEEDEESEDALQPMHDQLKLFSPWWILEIIPFCRYVQNQKNWSWEPHWRYAFPEFSSPLYVTHVGVVVPLRINIGRARQIPGPIRERKEIMYVHRSVQTMKKRGKYKPKVQFKHLNFEWAD